MFLTSAERAALGGIVGASRQREPKKRRKKRTKSRKKKVVPTLMLDGENQQDFDKDAVTESPKDVDDAEQELDEDSPPGDNKAASVALMRFLEGSIAKLVDNKVTISGADRFGANLFLAGACEVVKQDSALNYNQFVQLLKKVLALVGNKPDVAQKLADKYEEYLLEPQYIAMFQAGSSALERYLKGDEGATSLIASALSDWRNPKKDSVSTTEGPIAVVFTDIVGSTKLTQELGDEGAQKVVRVHNAIVRVALKDFQGKEVKHTGDGIMARFAKSHQAVEAALIMVKGLEAHNAQSPELPLHMRIGINAGEPIVEENDLFGSTVQMAARICDAAETDKILVSNIVRELSQGKSLNFVEAGKYGMKGIEGPVVLYEPGQK